MASGIQVTAVTTATTTTVASAPASGLIFRIGEGMFVIRNNANTSVTFDLHINDGASRKILTITIPKNSNWTNSAGEKIDWVLGSSDSIEAVTVGTPDLVFMVSKLEGAE